MPSKFDTMHARYDDDDDDHRGGGRPRGRAVKPTSAGMIGFIAAIVSLGLLVVVLILYVFLQQEEQLQRNVERIRWMYYWFLFLDLVSFFVALTAVVMCGRGVAPSNPLYRGWAILGLVLGIIELLTTIGLGLFMTCAVMLVEIGRARPGG